MKKLLLLTMALLPSYIFAQCYTQKDEFTNQTTNIYAIIPGGVKNLGTIFSLARTEKILNLYFTYTVPGSKSNLSTMVETKLMIKLGNGEILNFNPSSKSSITSYMENKNYNFIADLSKEDIDKIANSNIDVLRFSVDNYQIDIKFLQKDKDKILKALICIQ